MPVAARELFAYVLLAATLAFFLSWGNTTGTRRLWFFEDGGNVGAQRVGILPKIPDFSRYAPVRTLSAEEFPLDDPERRVIFVGDIHGMYKPFSQLLHKLEYRPDVDVLIHTGDFLSKGLHHQSLEVLDFMTLHNITGVRGNHDQQVIEWKGWINWITSTPEGSAWLKRTERNWRRVHSHKPKDLEEFVHDASQGKDKQWWKLVPVGWKFLSDHYRIAREMTDEHYQYLLRLPVALHAPNAHTFVAHAGLLPSNPKYPYFETPRQPLAHVPRLSTKACVSGNGTGCVQQLRARQEKAILTQVPQNRDPWVLMNIRSVTKKGNVSRKYAGVDWTKLWNEQMKLCVGYNGGLLSEDASDGDVIEKKKGKKEVHTLPCYPSTIVYGHSAAQGFRPKRWSIGLDSGCVYGRSLTAMVVTGQKTSYLEAQDTELEYDNVDDEEEEEEENVDHWEEHEDEDDGSEDEDDIDDIESAKKRQKRRKKGGKSIRFGENHRGKIVSVKCH